MFDNIGDRHQVLSPFFLSLRTKCILMLTLSQLEQYLSKAAWILKGPVDAADFKVYLFPLLFFKRISDVYDEEYNEALFQKAYMYIREYY